MADLLFGERLKKLRIEKGLTQQDLADLLFVSRRCVGNWEASTRTPDIATMTTIANALNVDSGYFFQDVQDSPQIPEVIILNNDPYFIKEEGRLLEKALPKAHVRAFNRVELALDHASSNKISVAFLELFGDIEQVFSLAKELTALNPRINVIFISESSEHAMRAFQTFCSGYMIKPLTQTKILEQIGHLRFPVKGVNGDGSV